MLLTVIDKQEGTGVMIIGVTGGIACGKSEVCRILERKGFVHIDSDDVAHEVLEIPSVVNEITSYFGVDVAKKRNEDADIIFIDRKALGKIVFADPEKMNVLEKITRPRIVESIKQRVLSEPNRDYVIEGIALVSSGLCDIFNELWVVHAEPAQQIDRLVKYRGMTFEEAMDRLESQEDHDWDEKAADRVIYSIEPLEKMEEQVEAALEELQTNRSVKSEK